MRPDAALIEPAREALTTAVSSTRADVWFDALHRSHAMTDTETGRPLASHVRILVPTRLVATRTLAPSFHFTPPFLPAGRRFRAATPLIDILGSLIRNLPILLTPPIVNPDMTLLERDRRRRSLIETKSGQKAVIDVVDHGADPVLFETLFCILRLDGHVTA